MNLSHLLKSRTIYTSKGIFIDVWQIDDKGTHLLKCLKLYKKGDDEHDNGDKLQKTHRISERAEN